MKKVISILAAVLIISLSVIPAFAESVESPSPTKANYNVVVIPTEGGTATYTYDTEVKDDGTQTVTIHAVPDEGYEFVRWDIEGATPRGGTPEDPDLTFLIGADITVTPHFVKTGEAETQPATKGGDEKGTTPEGGKPSPSGDKSYVDGGSKSPQTGSNDVVTFAVLSVVALALVSTVVIAKKSSKK